MSFAQRVQADLTPRLHERQVLELLEGLGELPHDDHAERAVLSILLSAPHSISKIGGTILPTKFYQVRHQLIVSAFLDLHNNGYGIDAVTLGAELERRGQLDEIGGRIYLLELSGRFISAENLAFHVVILSEKEVQRRRIIAAAKVLEQSKASADVLAFQKLLAELESTALPSESAEPFVEVSADDVQTPEILVEGLAYKGCVTIIAGVSGSFKSLFIQDRLNSYRDRSTYLVDFDLSGAMFWLRQRQMKNRGSVFPVRMNPNGSLLADFKSREFWRALGRHVERFGSSIVVFDTLLDFLEGDFSRGGDLNRPLQYCRDFASRHQVAVVLITHTTKSSWKRDDIVLADVADSRVVTTKADLVLGFQYGKGAHGVNLLRVSTLKFRFGALADPTVYRVETPATHPEGIFEFVPTSEAFPSIESKGETEAVKSAIDDLTDFLLEGKRPSSEVQEYLQQQGYTNKIIRCAREKICRKPSKEGKIWFWQLKVDQLAQDALCLGEGQVGQLEMEEQ